MRALRIAGFLLGLLPSLVIAAEKSALMSALESITREELGAHVDLLAADTFEGRAAGSRGGRAASTYIARQFAAVGLKPAGLRGTYFQSFEGAKRNVLGMLEGSDPNLRSQYILLGAHYDHVGYGTPQNSYGPTGYIHNGADDNASGVAGLLEIAQSLKTEGVQPRRSILFVCWDGEEQGLLGSKHWLAEPTVPLRSVKLAMNLDMIGRLRDNKVEVHGTRSSWGLRRLVAEQAGGSGLRFDFTWEMKENSDHWSFYSHKVPVLMLHTGLHGDYHRPRDDAHKINRAGMERVSRVLLRILIAAADADSLSGYRRRSESESPQDRGTLERPLSPLPPRLGVWCYSEPRETEQQGVLIKRVQEGGAAQAAGLGAGDRLLSVGGRPIASAEQLQTVIARAPAATRATILRRGEAAPRAIGLVLAGKPVRVGINWRTDEAEPGTVLLTRIVTGSPADQAGLTPGDRIYEIGGKQFRDDRQFLELLHKSSGATELLAEHQGRLRYVTLHLSPHAER